MLLMCKGCEQRMGASEEEEEEEEEEPLFATEPTI